MASSTPTAAGGGTSSRRLSNQRESHPTMMAPSNPPTPPATTTTTRDRCRRCFQDNKLSRWISRTLQRTVLQPQFPLQRQLFLSFGTSAMLAISFFILIGTLNAYLSGQTVMKEARDVQEDLARYTLSTSTRYVAETLTKQFNNYQTASDMIREATRDRIVGYKTSYFNSINQTVSDRYIPFINRDTGQPMYPLHTPQLMRLDWNTTGTTTTIRSEDFHGREQWYPAELYASTAYASYFMQGSCNPNSSHINPEYYPNCSAANNNLQTGGVVSPSPDNFALATKVQDIVFVLKALYESHAKVKQLGVYLFNGGAGSYVKFPSMMRDNRGTVHLMSCDWLNMTINPWTDKLIATPEELERCQYRPGGTNPGNDVVDNQNTKRYAAREYNPMQRPFCIRQAQQPLEEQHVNAVITGPYLDTATGVAEKVWILTFGHGIFDRVSQEFIGCTLVDVSVNDIQDTLNNFHIGDTSAVALMRWEDRNTNGGKPPPPRHHYRNEAGTVVACGQCQLDPPHTRNEPYHIIDLADDFGIDQALFDEITQLVDFNTKWDPVLVKEIYNQTLFHKNGRLFMMYPVPYIPTQYDPTYHPTFMIVMSLSEDEIYGDSDVMDSIILKDIRDVAWGISLIGLSGLLVIFAFLTWISRTLTKPLTWMQETTAQVINNAGSDDFMAGNIATNTGGSGSAAGLARCSPQTEVTVLLSEFEMMMDGFSGKGAAEVADTKIVEVQNKFQWREAYQVLYPYNFLSSNTDSTGDSDEEAVGIGERHGHTMADIASVNTERTFLSTLTELSLVQSLIVQPYDELKTSLSKSMSSFAQASYTAGFEKLPGWAQNMLVKSDEEDDMPDYVVSPPKVNLGHNICSSGSGDEDAKGAVEVSSSSKVFQWLCCTVGVPIMLTATAIVSLGELWIRDNVDKWLADVKAVSSMIEKDAVVTATLARAVFGQEVVSRFMRDLHVYARTTGWLLFGGLQRSGSFSQMRSGSEECKTYEENTFDCPFKTEDVPCDCAWDDNYASEGQCINYDSQGINSSRYLQTNMFEGLRSDIDPSTGNRVASSFPNISTSPEETAWWASPDEMPGASKGAQASGFSTVYDRVRVLSALSVIHFPMYNYFPGRDERIHLGSYVGLAADGMMIGYVGCDGSHADFPFFQSTTENRASEIAPDLCPVDQFGYDCRCRDWFASAAKEGTYISPPYPFATASTIGSSAAAAVRDTNTTELVAVALLDFLPNAFIKALGPDSTVIGHSDKGFPLVITPHEDVFGGNTVIGPDYDLSNDGPKSILDVTLPEDDKGSLNRKKFRIAVSSMEDGNMGNATFVRMDDCKEESLFLAYAPVSVRVLQPLDHRDFSAGCNVSSMLVYSLGIAVAEDDLYLRFESVESNADSQLNLARGFSIFAMLVIAISFTILTYFITLNLTRPIIALTKIVKSIKNKSLRDELPDVDGGSREVSFVHESFQRLLKVVRFANLAFFAGDRTQSYHSMEDALNLFLKLGNQKAIGVANNNLGTMVLQEQMEAHGTDRLFDNSLFGICISEIYFVGINYFDEAIRHGNFEYEISKDTDDQASYAKQLANRYFNRGMFLVVVRHHPLCPSWIHEDGVSDILRAKDLDLEHLQLLHKYNVFCEHEVQEFESLLRRARGILSLVRNYGFQDPWGIESLIDQAETLLNEAHDLDSNLFDNMSRVGRRQQIDDLKMQHALCQKDYATAATIAMRMLVEDEYIIDTIIVNASTAVDQYMKQEKIRVPPINATQYLQRETRRAQVNVLREAKNVFFCLDYSGSMAGDRMKRANKNLRWVYDEHCSDKDMVGFIRFNHDIDDKLWFPLGKKGDWGQVQEAVLALATDAEGGTRLYAALNRCVTQILNTETKNDTWIIALTDGESSWDHPAKRVEERIRKANKQRNVKIHVIVIGFEVPASVIKSCEAITSVSDKSLYVDARGDLDEMDKAFEQVVSVIGGSAITMETF